jgi:hypothetical protein
MSDVSSLLGINLKKDHQQYVDTLELAITRVDNHIHTYERSEHKVTLNIKEFRSLRRMSFLNHYSTYERKHNTK